MADETVVPGSEPNPQGSGESQNTETVEALQKRLRDMQSMKDRAEAQLRQVAPIIEQIRSRPDVIEALQSPRTVPSRGEDQDAIPQKPEAPEGYDEHAALHEPGSESWKYRKAVEKWRDRMLEYQTTQVTKAQVEAQRRLEAQREMAQVGQIKSGMRDWAMATKGVDASTAMRFVDRVSDDATFKGPNGEPDLELLWVVDQAVQAYRNGERVPAPAKKPADFGPAPGIGSSQAATGSEDETRSFNAGLLSHRRRLRVSGR